MKPPNRRFSERSLISENGVVWYVVCHTTFVYYGSMFDFPKISHTGKPRTLGGGRQTYKGAALRLDAPVELLSRILVRLAPRSRTRRRHDACGHDALI